MTAAGFAQLIGDMIDSGSREHYLDAALYDYEYRRRRADVSFYRELARRRGADRILELGAGTGRVTVPLARDAVATSTLLCIPVLVVIAGLLS